MQLPVAIKQLGAALLLTALSIATFAQSKGFDVTHMDKDAKACDDFYQYANGTWLKNLEIPAKYPSYGTGVIVYEENQKLLREILESAAKETTAKPGSDEQLVGDLYASCMDGAKIEANGAKTFEPTFKQIESIKNSNDLVAMIAKLHRANIGALFGFGPLPDFKNSSMNMAIAGQGGLSLPDRDYYLKTEDKSKQIREQFLQHVANMFVLAGEDAAKAKADAQVVMTLQTRLAGASKTNVELRDPVANYNKMSLSDFQKLTPNYDWNKYLTALGTPRVTDLNVAHPDFFKEANKMMMDVSLNDWKTYLRWMTLDNTPSLALPKKFDDERFNFYSRTLRGVKEQRPRVERCTTSVDALVGESLGQVYIKRAFTPAAKARMDALITNLFAAYKERIQSLDWMTPATKEQALIKLAAFQRKIGYPDKLRGYVGLKIDRNSYFDNYRRATEFSTARDLQDIGQPVDKTRWDMTAPTLNAYYNPLGNEIVFPAGILRPPLFDADADDAYNYGGIGAVIGHEITHGFDDQGSQFDAQGNLRMWWTPDDRQKFEAKADCVSKQFSAYEVLPGVFMQGKLTLGENIADLGGLRMAYAAYQKSLAGKPHAVDANGFTPEQRFFLGYARVWAAKARDEAVRVQVQTDPHAVARWRAVGPLSNMTEFAEAFQCKTGDKMVHDDRCQIW